MTLKSGSPQASGWHELGQGTLFVEATLVHVTVVPLITVVQKVTKDSTA